MTSHKTSHKAAAAPSAAPSAAPAPPTVAAARDPKSPLRLIDRTELLRRIPFSFPTIWTWMKAGEFPRSRDTGGKATWVESEIDRWISERPRKLLKGDDGWQRKGADKESA
ncbi:AlpA family phage regulatory protein [Bradyrhizobium sp. CSA207]|uniref:helix-turn-helix transcriptional regulator n=1 Tax=Bradyrhizobium sp. CSA207 TaxID=2698826 RepID=UPI0023AF894F|nr:AlpA family phage regulatory protein [Bradyrhizobium sp. CSA207]MDE5440532.1 AlpA family phage regulatory protein [Bradyrhizobium sp. CSA207]